MITLWRPAAQREWPRGAAWRSMQWQPLLIAVLFVLSLAALLAGCIGLWRRKPLVVTGPGVAVALVGTTIALLGAAAWLVLELDRGAAALAGFVVTAFGSVMLVRAVHAAESSCLVIGTTRRWVRDALRASFFRMSIRIHDESMEEDASRAGNTVPAMQRLSGYRPVHLVRTHNPRAGVPGGDLARQMDEYFASNAVCTDTAALRAMAAAGVVLLVAAVYVWLRWFVA
jgi:hypothetical protein